jgi:hypothetical protein
MEFPFTSTMQEVPTSETHKAPSKMSSFTGHSQHIKELKHGNTLSKKITDLFPAREGLVSDIPAGDVKIGNLFLQCINRDRVITIFSFVEGPHPHRHLHLVAHPAAQLLLQLLKLFSCCSAAAPAASVAPGAPSLLFCSFNTLVSPLTPSSTFSFMPHFICKCLYVNVTTNQSHKITLTK